MQGNKKCADGFSDTSSIGSVLDDADREVSSLTDRAFRSLCISEDTSFSDSDLTLSPELTRQVLGSFHQGSVSHTRRKSGIWSQLPSQGTEHTGWAATFQQLPKYVQGEEEYPKSSPPLTPAQRRLEVPISGLRSSSKPISKVSSLIRSFDRPESQQCDSRPPTSKPPAIKTPPKFAPLPESGVNFCFDSAFLTVRRVPAEVSGAHAQGHQPGRKHPEREAPRSPEMACQGPSSFHPTPENGASSLEPKFSSPPHKPAVDEPGRSKEWARKGTFLHSANSAFESWSSRQPRLRDRKDPAQAIPENKAPKPYDSTPLLREPLAPERSVSPCQLRASCGQEESRLATGTLSTPGPWRAAAPGTQVSPGEDSASSAQPDLPRKSAQAPWRKPKARRGGQERAHDPAEEKQTSRRGPALCAKHDSQGQFPENEAPDSAGDPSDCYTPPFNISELLTPVLPTKQVLDPSSSPRGETAPPPPGQLNGYQEKEPSDSPSRDSYRAAAPGLLFRLKGVRRRVKSTYSPSPLLRGLDETSRGKQEPVSNGGLPNGLEESPPQAPPEERPTDPPLSYVSTQRDPKADPTPGSPPAITEAPCYVNGEAADKNSPEQDAIKEGSELGAARYSWSPEPRERLALPLCSTEPEAGRAVRPLEIPRLENGFSRSVSQETEPEREAGLQNPNFTQKVSPGPLSPEEEDVFYSDTQSDFVPGRQGKAKFSTSSSDQSFASFEDQQKPWLAAESQQEDRSALSAGDGQKDETGAQTGTEEPRHSAFGDGPTCVEGQSKRQLWQAEGEHVGGGRPQKVSREEADWSGGSKGAALSHAKDPSPSPALNRHRLFTIKDNTLRATPVIRPIMLPLLRALSSEDPLGSGHREEALPRPSKSQEMPSTPIPTGMRGPPVKHVAHRGVSSVSRMETKGTVSSIPLAEEGKGVEPPSDALWKAVVSDSEGRSCSTDPGKLEAPRCIPTIALPEGGSQDQRPPQQLRMSWEEQTQDGKSHFLCTPRAGPPGRWGASELATSPHSSSLEGSSGHSPAASSVWDDTYQGPSELGLMPGEPSRASPSANPSPARAARREDLTHAFMWEASSDPQLEPSAEYLRALSPGGSVLDVATSSAIFPEKAEPSSHLERAAAKPPAVPPKTEKALRRAKKLASKRRKTDQAQEAPGKAQEEKPPLEDAEHRPLSPGERPLPRFPAVRALPPPVHRHSVSTFPEPLRRRPARPQSLMPLLPYPATQKVLQDPQSGEYFVFDLPLQVKMKTFYDPETGKYVKVPIPSSEEGSPEPLPLDVLAGPYVLYPGIRPLPAAAVMPPRCSSQLSSPTFLRQGPGTLEAACPGPRSAHHADRQPAPGPHSDPTQHMAGPGPSESPRIPGEGAADTPSLGIICTNDLEDFATEGIS